MLNILLRALILFALVYIVIRLMGKRQVGELQPTEFVVALMAADLATMPMGDLAIPLLWGIISLMVLLLMQVVISYASMKSVRARRILCGEPTVLISKGIINEYALRKQRYNINDLLEQLRTKDIFDISKVWYALLETNGELSVILKSDFAAPCNSDMGLSPAQEELCLTLISDGKIMEKNLAAVSLSKAKLARAISSSGLKLSEVLIAQSNGDKIYVQPRKEEQGCFIRVK